ncbi:conjugal transfer protein TraG [Plesiomonas shigelloides]|uniref:virB8 family protein n=1 Tax=Plesiomonas shigelloides TaxID=703 RepID=UPI001261FD1D|nr:type IV secretion system protein [Plesiomonas shigelloides]KAB7715123.1 conjugal transfer protein TraG [Plesiomonas shigelloides]
MSTHDADYFEKTKEIAMKTVVDTKKEDESYYQAVKSFEQGNIDSLKKQRFLLSIGICVFLAVIFALAFAIAAMAPLKTVEAYAIRVDNSTGYTDIVKPIENEKATYDEVVNKYWISQFVINYESYDWQTISTMNDTVQLMSSSNVFSEYRRNILAPNSPLNILKDNYKIKTKIKSVTFLEEDTAQVRFSKIVLTSAGEPANEYVTTNWVATVAFDFKHEIKTEGERLLNPLGFNVLSYRVDPETTK